MQKPAEHCAWTNAFNASECFTHSLMYKQLSCGYQELRGTKAYCQCSSMKSFHLKYIIIFLCEQTYALLIQRVDGKEKDRSGV